MAKLITKFKFIKPGSKAGSYLKYIATREGVDKIDDSKKNLPASKKQKDLIAQILRDFPDAKEMHEFDDYLRTVTVGDASEFITRALEDNAQEMMSGKTYADYIATRPRAQRFGSHGLFTDDGVEIKLSKVSEELNLHQGNVWTAILSLRREDAARLGFDDGYRWRDMLRTQTNALSKNLKIPLENLRWFAAYHDESHHPHVHLIAYSTVPSEGYLTKQGVNNLRSSFAKDIFAQDLLCVYEQQTEHRDTLKAESRKLMGEIIKKINTGTYDNPAVESMLVKLAGRLSKTSGKKVYGYLKADVKDLIDAIVDELAKDERLAALYDLWYQKREQVIQTYTKEMPERVPLSQNQEFKSIRNAVIQEAMNIIANRIADEDEDDAAALEPQEDEIPDEIPTSEPTEPDIPPTSSGKSRKNNSWWTDAYKEARNFLYGTKAEPADPQKAFALMRAEADTGNGFAMHDLGKMYLSGLGCDADENTAQEWFRKAYHAFLHEEQTAKKPDYLQYRIGKLFSFGYGVEQDDMQAAVWYEKAVAEGNPFAAYSLGSLYRRGQGVAQDDEKAFALYRVAAEHETKPNAYAMYELGRMYQGGIGTAPDKEKSTEWYAAAYKGFLAIEQNMADDKLYYRIGQMNLTGTGTEKDLPKAKEYFEKAAALDNVDALYGLGRLYLNRDFAENDPQKALDYLITAAQKGHSYAQYTLGKLFLKGEAVMQNVDYALRWLEEAVRQDNTDAQCLLGKVLLHGEVIEQDANRAATLLKKAVENGSSYAAYLLGKAYLDGTALMQNVPEAIRLLTESAGKGFTPAEYLLGKLLYKGEVIPQDIPKAFAYLERAAEKENSYAAYLAGKILLTEDAVKDVPKAIRLLKIAAEHGNDFAEYQLGKLYLYGKDVQQDYAEAIRWLTASAEHGNQYAEQLLHSIRNNRNWSAAMGAFRLLHHISRIIQNRLEDERRGKGGALIDRKLRRKIQDKKEALGMKQG